MTRRNSIVGITLFSALMLCAAIAQSASAAWVPSTNTTAFTCSPTAVVKDYEDAHCDNTSGATGAKNFGHTLISGKTEVETSNTETKTSTTQAEPAILESTVLGNKVTITCNKVEPDTLAVSYLENTEPETGKHRIKGTSAVNFTECVVTGNGAGCAVVGGEITLKTEVESVEGTGADAGKMALEFKPDPAGGPYVVIKFVGAKCLVLEAEVTGSARGTGSGAMATGATLEFKPEDEELFFGPAHAAATFKGKFTSRMKEVNSVKQPAITGTTTT